MRTIISRTINSEVSPRISLGSDEIYRPLSVGGNWNKLRIGLSLVFTYPGADLAGQPRFFVGVCSRYKSWGSWNAHALGMVSTGAAWNANAGPPINFSYQMAPVQVIGQTETSLGGAGSSLTVAATTSRHYFFLLINKTGGIVTMTTFRATNSISGVYDINPAFARDLTEMDVPTAASFSSLFYTASTTLDEAANGALDCVNIGWSRTDAPLEINEITLAYNR